MDPQLKRWLAEGPPDFAHAPRYPLRAWAKSWAASKKGLTPDPGEPPGKHLDGELVSDTERTECMRAAQQELSALLGGTHEERTG